jgi:hypothetical protein
VLKSVSENNATKDQLHGSGISAPLLIRQLIQQWPVVDLTHLQAWSTERGKSVEAFQMQGLKLPAVPPSTGSGVEH